VITGSISADSQVDLCLRAGYLALRYIAAFFRISSHPNPSPTDPISVSRAEFEAALDELAEAGVPLKADREQAWRDFSGWRVNYDSVLLTLAELTIAPPARWSSDRRRPGSHPALAQRPQTDRNQRMDSPFDYVNVAQGDGERTTLV